jgi:hypothetical protein
MEGQPRTYEEIIRVFQETDGPVTLSPEEAQVMRLKAVQEAGGVPPFNRAMRRMQKKSRNG